MKMKKLLALALAVILLAVGLAACGGGAANGGPAVRVGSKDFTESLVVAEIYALALEDAGLNVERKLNIAGSIVHGAITSDEIDLYPEYTGTGLLTILQMDMVSDPDAVYDIVSREYNQRFGITWLAPSEANDSNGLVIRTQVAEELGIYTISNLQANAGQIRVASQGEFELREDGIPGLEKVYGPFEFASITVYDNGLKYQILENDEADLAPAYTTEGQLANTELFTLLEDDKGFWPPYRLTPIVRNEVLEANPEIRTVLDAVSATLDTATVTSLNAAVDLDQREYEEVAAEYYETIKSEVPTA